MPTRKYSSRSQQTTLTAGINSTTTSATVVSGSALLGGITISAGETFTVVIDPDTALEEIVDVTAVSTNTLTIVRAIDTSPATGQAHSADAVVRHMAIDENDEPQVLDIRAKLTKILAQHQGIQLFITQGYICKNARGEVDNLKRGGSDYSASLIAAAVDASVCEIWTDIDGMHNNDPRVVQSTRPVEQLSFDEAAELAYFGAKILHPASIWPAQQFNIPVKLLNTMQPEAKGTVILEEADADGVKAVAAKDGIVMVKIKSSRMLLAYGFLRKIFEVFEKYKTSIDMITTSEVAVSVTIDNTTHLDQISKELAPLGELEVLQGQTIIAVVGNKLNSEKNLLSNLFNSLSHLTINMVSYGGSLHNVSILIPTEEKNECLKSLNKGLFGLD